MKKCRQQQNFDSGPKEAWHYNNVIFTPIVKKFMPYCRLIYMLSLLYVTLNLFALRQKIEFGFCEKKIGIFLILETCDG